MISHSAGLNRLNSATFVNAGLYNTSYTYDANGNIETLNRSMNISGIAEPIDQLDYDYNGNQLKKVDDALGTYFENNGFKDNGSYQTIEYDYDANGNMVLDKNKSLDVIQYNHMNLPTSIVFNNGLPEEKSIGYIYTATGAKLQKHTFINNNSESTTTDYIGAFVYEDNVLQFIQTSEGRLVPNGNGEFNYEYAIKDHLGNTRVMFDQTGEVLQDQSYYPFGMSMGEALTFDMPSSLPDNKYLYNGKELQDDFDLGWYDYGARFYDPQLGRWQVVDPLAEQRISLSVYNYCSLNPINRIDPDGALDDNYSVDKDGTIRKEEDTNDDFDVVYTKEDWDSGNTGSDNTNNVIVKDQEILPQLVDSQNEPEYDYEGNVVGESKLRTSSSSSKTDLTNLFSFVANNTNVEWSLYNTENKMYLGTYGWDDLSPGASTYGIGDNDVISMVHSHPNPVTLKDENESLWGDKRVALKVKYKYFTYMKNSGNLYLLNNSANPGNIKRTPNVTKKGLYKRLTDN